MEERGHEPRIVRYLDTPPSAAELKEVVRLLGSSPRELVRTNDPLYGSLGLSDVDSDDALIAAMVENPALIERPVIIAGERAIIGRPPERVIELL